MMNGGDGVYPDLIPLIRDFWRPRFQLKKVPSRADLDSLSGWAQWLTPPCCWKLPPLNISNSLTDLISGLFRSLEVHTPRAVAAGIGLGSSLCLAAVVRSLPVGHVRRMYTP